jgi:hypothetical protein
MTHDDSVQIAAASSGRRRALARAATRERVEDATVDTSPIPAMAERRPRDRGIALRRHAKFYALQSLESSYVVPTPPQAGGTSRADEEGANYGGRLRYRDRLYFLGRRFGSPGDSPLVGSGQQAISFWKNETRGTVFPCRSTIATPSPRPAGSSSRRGGRKNLEMDTLGLEPCNPLKSHKTAKGIFGNPWTETA